MARACAVVVLLLAALPARGQTTVGARLGGIYSAPIAAGDGFSGRAGLGLVAFAEHPVRPRLMLGAEIGVLQGGFRQELTAAQTDEPGTLRVRVTLFTMAPVVTLAPATTLGSGRRVQPEVFAGPRLDFRTTETATLNGQTGRLREYDETMLGLSAGAGVRLPVSRTTLRLDARMSRMRATNRRSELQTELRVGLTL